MLVLELEALFRLKRLFVFCYHSCAETTFDNGEICFMPSAFI